jgi:hypothetical protein
VLGFFGNRIIRQRKAIAGITICGFHIKGLGKILNGPVIIANAKGIVTAPDIVFDTGYQQ